MKVPFIYYTIKAEVSMRSMKKILLHRMNM